MWARAHSILLFLAISSLLCGSGCVAGYVRVHLTTTRDMNGGAPLYMVVRSIEFKRPITPNAEPNLDSSGLMDLFVRNTQTRQTAGQSYGEIVALLDAPDGSVVRTQVLYPGHSYRFFVKAPSKGALGLYFLFANPGGAWNLILDQPIPWRVHAALHGNTVSRQGAR